MVERYLKTPPFARKELRAAGLQTNYLEAGNTGAPIVLVHGGGAGADAEGNWAGVIPHLSDQYRVYAPDMPGFGFSEKPDRDDYTYSQDERDEHLAAFIEALGAGPVILVGNSMGGLTSLSVAGTRPDLVARLVLMGSAGVPVPMSPQLGTIINYDFSVEGMEAIVEALTGPDFVAPAGMVTYRHQLSTDADTRRAYKAITGWNKARGGLHVDEALIRAIAVPTLVTGGKDDGVVPVSCAYKFLDLIEQSYGFIFPRCGHWPMIEFPAQFAQVVNDFIQMDALSA